MTQQNKIELQPGDTAPQFTLTDSEGNQVSLSDYSGQKVLLYFYPKADTPGCTKESCDFRDSLTVFNTLGIAVLGISADNPEKNEKFKQKYSLNFPLLSDPDHETMLKYGAYGEKKNYGNLFKGIIRSTFLVDGQGKIELAQYNVKATGHVARVIKELEAA